jgi:Transposase IS66 family
MLKPVRVPEIPEAKQTPLVRGLVGIIEEQAEQLRQQEELIGQLKEEIAVLKGEKKRPRFKASGLEEKAGQEKESEAGAKRRAGSEKRSKTEFLEIHEERAIAPKAIPAGSRFKGYEDYVVQGLIIRAHNTRYRLERWQTPAGGMLLGELPEAVRGQHFSPELRGYILYQYYPAHVTRPLLLEQLREWGVDISAGQIERILNEGKERFHQEKALILRVGLEVAEYLTVDDTGARHQGKNGYTTQLGTEHFAWFESTQTKDRINFLSLLQGGTPSYVINAQALQYMQEQKLPKGPWEQLKNSTTRVFEGTEQWQAHLCALNLTTKRHIRLATEGALLGALRQGDLAETLAIISDDAGQFDVLTHGLCWVHAERLIHQLIPLNEPHREDQQAIRAQVWDFYADLKKYKQAPSAKKKAELDRRFDEIFTTKTRFETLNQVLKRLHRNKSELLLVLERPEVPLHTNDSERDIRDYVKKRKVSGGTRSDLGRRCRDTFASLKKTCRKLGVSFWEFLLDRVSATNRIPPLSSLIRERATAH